MASLLLDTGLRIDEALSVSRCRYFIVVVTCVCPEGEQLSDLRLAQGGGDPLLGLEQGKPDQLGIVPFLMQPSAEGVECLKVRVHGPGP